MKISKRILSHFSFLKRYRYTLVAHIAILWPIVDLIIMVTRNNPAHYNTFEAMSLRTFVVFLLSILMGYLLVFKLKKVLRHYSFGLTLLVRGTILILAAFLMNFLTETIHTIVISGLSFVDSIRRFLFLLWYSWYLHS